MSYSPEQLRASMEHSTRLWTFEDLQRNWPTSLEQVDVAKLVASLAAAHALLISYGKMSTELERLTMETEGLFHDTRIVLGEKSK